MSGGSYDYLYVWLELKPDPDTIDRMIARLRELDANDAADELQGMVDHVHRTAERMADLLHDVEWLDSGDYGPDQVKEAIEEYRAETVRVKEE